MSFGGRLRTRPVATLGIAVCAAALGGGYLLMRLFSWGESEPAPTAEETAPGSRAGRDPVLTAVPGAEVPQDHGMEPLVTAAPDHVAEGAETSAEPGARWDAGLRPEGALSAASAAKGARKRDAPAAREVGRKPRDARASSASDDGRPAQTSSSAEAARNAFLIDALGSAPDPRVRAKAAMALGRVRTKDAASVLLSALKDANPAVRVAAATSLARTGNRNALAALKTLQQRDPDPDVRQAAARSVQKLQPPAARSPSAAADRPEPGIAPKYYLRVGTPRAAPGTVDSFALDRVRAAITRQLRTVRGLRLAPAGEAPAAARHILQQEGRAGFFLDVSVVSLQRNELGTRAAVSVILSTYPGRDIRAALQGAATAQGVADQKQAGQEAVDAAVRSALRRLPQAMASAARR